MLNKYIYLNNYFFGTIFDITKGLWEVKNKISK